MTIGQKRPSVGAKETYYRGKRDLQAWAQRVEDDESGYVDQHYPQDGQLEPKVVA